MLFLCHSASTPKLEPESWVHRNEGNDARGEDLRVGWFWPGYLPFFSVCASVGQVRSHIRVNIIRRGQKGIHFFAFNIWEFRGFQREQEL